jgi:hypothetical protein
MWHLTFSGKLYLAPIPKDQSFTALPILEPGTGIWAIDFGMVPPSGSNKS